MAFICLFGLLWGAPVRAGDPIRLAAWCSDSSREQMGKSAVDELVRLWKLLDMTLTDYKGFSRTARKLGIRSDHLLKPASIQRVCGKLKLDGLVMGHVRTDANRTSIDFHLYNQQGKLLLVKSYPLRANGMKSQQLERLAAELLDRLGRRPGLVAWSVDETQKGLGKHTEAMLARSLESRGLRPVGFSTYHEVAQAMGIHYDDLLRPAAIQRIQKLLNFAGILLIKAAAQGRLNVIDFHLYDEDGRLLLVKSYRLRRPAMLERQVDGLVFDVVGYLQRARQQNAKLSEKSTTEQRPQPREAGHPAAGAAIQPEKKPESGINVVVETELSSMATSNVFMDQREESDISFRPVLNLGLDFAEIWSLGYTGEMNRFLEHEELFSHWHELYLFVNPAWGEKSQNEFVGQLSLEALRNEDVKYELLNNLQPNLMLKMTLQPFSWLRWLLSTSAAFRWFYSDEPSTSLDVWVRSSAVVSLPFRAAIKPSIAYGYRHYLAPEAPDESGAEPDERDQQLEVGLHYSQGLWRTAGLQLDYEYRSAFGVSGVIRRLFEGSTEGQLTYLGHQFLYSGHEVGLGFTQLISRQARTGCWAGVEERKFGGWPIGFDQVTGRPLEDRHDWRMSARAFFSFSWHPDYKTISRIVPALGINLSYSFTRQWSNMDWFDTQAHMGLLSLWLSW